MIELRCLYYFKGKDRPSCSGYGSQWSSTVDHLTDALRGAYEEGVDHNQMPVCDAPMWHLQNSRLKRSSSQICTC